VRGTGIESGSRGRYEPRTALGRLRRLAGTCSLAGCWMSRGGSGAVSLDSRRSTPRFSPPACAAQPARQGALGGRSALGCSLLSSSLVTTYFDHLSAAFDHLSSVFGHLSAVSGSEARGLHPLISSIPSCGGESTFGPALPDPSAISRSVRWCRSARWQDRVLGWLDPVSGVLTAAGTSSLGSRPDSTRRPVMACRIGLLERCDWGASRGRPRS